MADSHPLPDYYAALQVHPDADQEVIEAAYRQLMKKHHPDIAGDDGRDAATKHRVASTLNQAYGVLRDPEQRREYDMARIRFGSRPRPAETVNGWHGPGQRGSYSDAPKPPPVTTETVDAQPDASVAAAVAPSPPQGPFAWLSALYYMLPGPYEWEDGRTADILATLMVPVVGTLAYALVTGKLVRLSGGSLGGSLVLTAFLVLLAVPFVKIAGQVMVAAVPAFLLVWGAVDPLLREAHVPPWAAWGIVTAVGVMAGARLFVFGVLPMLALCWWVARLSAT